MINQLNFPPRKQFPHRLQRIPIPQRPRLLLRHQHKIMHQHRTPLRDAKLPRLLSRRFAHRHNQRALDAEHRIRSDIVVGWDVQCGDQVIPARFLKHEMHMCRAPGVAVEEFEELAYGAVVRDGVADGADGFEPELTLLVTFHDGAAVGTIALSVLHVVVARGVCFPDIDFDAGDGGPGGVFDGTDDDTRFAFGVRGDVVARRKCFCFVGVERTEDGTFGAVGGFGVVDGVDEEGEAEDVAEEDEFL
jgi:hypothetical protein